MPGPSGHRRDVRSPAALADAAYHAAFDVERSAVLRRRITVCLGAILALLALSGLGSVVEYQEALEGKTPWTVFLIGAAYDVALACMSVAMLLYVLTRRPDRRRLVVALILWALSATAVIVYFEMRRSLMHPTTWMGDPLPEADPGANACRWGLVGMGVVTALSLLIVPMRWRESRWIGLGGAGIYTLQAVVIAGAGPATVAGFSGLALLVALASMSYSRWRYWMFDAAFEHRELRGRYGELSSELAHARNLHESLFPPRRGEGPVRVGFLYEPMREIGGDFLFMPDGAGGRSGEGPTYVVLIDVSGHGVASALAVNRLHGELVRLFAAAGSGSGKGSDLSAGDVMAALNTYVQLTLAPQAVFATGVCLKIEGAAAGLGAGIGGAPDGMRLQWSSAGHPPVFLRSAAQAVVGGSGGQGGVVHTLGATATMLGVLEGEAFDHGERSIPVVPGDVVIAYTDGLIETRDERGEDLGIAEVERIVRSWAPRMDGSGPTATPPRSLTLTGLGEAPPHDPPIATALLRAAAAKRGGGRVTDDTLVVEIAIAAATTPAGPERAMSGAGVASGPDSPAGRGPAA